MRILQTARLSLAIGFVALVPDAALAQLPAGLDAGPFSVGYRTVATTDPARPMGPRTRPGDRAGERARPLRIHVWYPAAGATGPAMTVADYIAAGAPRGTAPEAFATGHRQAMPRTVGFELTDPEWAAYTGAELTARRDAQPASGAFPLLIGMFRPVSVAVGAEHLASHGYVVAYVERQPREFVVAEGLVREGLILTEYVRDMDVAIAHLRARPEVDDVRLGAVGFSGDGLAQLVLAMRHPDVDALSLLETGWLSPTQVSSYQEMRAHDPAAMRAPFFYAYSENLGRNSLEHIRDIRAMRYAPRYLMYLGEPWMTHWDFVTEGIVMATRLERRRSVRDGVVRAFLATHQYQRRFLDAFVKGDASAVAALETAPAPAPGGTLIELTPLPAVVPAIARGEFRALLDSDAPRAMTRAREDLKQDPQAAVFEEAYLNALGYEFIQRTQMDKALEIFRLMTEARPRSANAFDSLSEALELAGRHPEALAAAERALTLLPADRTVPAAQRAALESGLKARIDRLRRETRT